MGIYLFDKIIDNFIAAGFDVDTFQFKGEDSVFFACRRYEGILHVIVASQRVDVKAPSYDEYKKVVDDFVMCSLPERYPDMQVKLLQIVYTIDPNQLINTIREIPCWIFDPRSNNVMRVEGSPSHFAGAEIVIMSTINQNRIGLAEKKGKDHGRTLVRMKKTNNVPLVTIILIIINVVVFFYLEIAGSTEDTMFMLRHGALSYHETVTQGQYYRLITHFFMHFGYDHLSSNMVALILVGYYIENYIKKWRFVTIYMVSGVLAGFISMNVYNYLGEPCVSAGASGAIFGLIGALTVLLILNRERFKNVGVFQIIFFLLVTIFSGSKSYQVDNYAHMAGFFVGLIIMTIMYLPSKELKK